MGMFFKRLAYILGGQLEEILNLPLEIMGYNKIEQEERVSQRFGAC